MISTAMVASCFHWSRMNTGNGSETADGSRRYYGKADKDHAARNAQKIAYLTPRINFYFQLNKISTFKYLPVFLTGTFLAIYHLKFSIPLRFKKLGIILSVAGFLALLVCILMNPNYVEGNWLGIDTSNNGRKIMIIYALLCGIMLFVSLYTTGLFKRFLETRFLRFIGVISFSIYLFHLPVIYLINHRIIDIPEGLKIYFFFGMTLFISTITYLIIERPMSRIAFPGSLSY
jgi:peptidoglycan/LPS O-acetylase OafA/YrhL